MSVKLAHIFKAIGYDPQDTVEYPVSTRANRFTNITSVITGETVFTPVITSVFTGVISDLQSDWLRPTGYGRGREHPSRAQHDQEIWGSG